MVTRPIEESVGSISGIKRVRSLSSQGASVVKLNFDWGTDLYEAENDVRKQLGFVERKSRKNLKSFYLNQQSLLEVLYFGKTHMLKIQHK